MEILINIINISKNRLRESATRVSEAYRNRPETPLKTAMWWVERVAETKGNLLMRPQHHLPVYVYYSFDVYAFFAVILILGIFVGKYMVEFLVGRLRLNLNNKLKVN